MQLTIATSTALDGSMKSTDRNFASVLPARTDFLQKHAINPASVTLVQVTYGGEDFCRFRTLSDNDKGDGITRDASIEADALVVTDPSHALILPLADCVGAVIHDPTKDILMVSHLGRHNLEQFAGTKCIEYLVDKHQVNPQDLTVWLSPAAGKENYPLYTFDNRSLHDVATEQLLTSGILKENISVSSIDVTVDQNYFSHSQFLKGNRTTDGRFAIVAMMRPDAT